MLNSFADSLPGQTSTERIILALVAGLPAIIAAYSSITNGNKIRDHAQRAERAVVAQREKIDDAVKEIKNGQK